MAGPAARPHAAQPSRPGRPPVGPAARGGLPVLEPDYAVGINSAGGRPPAATKSSAAEFMQ